MIRAKMQKHEIATMEVNQGAQDDYNEQQESLMKDLVFSDSCSSWCESEMTVTRETPLTHSLLQTRAATRTVTRTRSSLGVVGLISDAPFYLADRPYTVLSFLELLETPRWEDWTFKSMRENRFSFLGNGTSTVRNLIH